MNALLRDLYGHQGWADAETWRAVEAFPAAADDEIIKTRLHHIHLVQRIFLWAVGTRDTPLAFTHVNDFATLDDLKLYAREYYAGLSGFLAAMTNSRFDVRVQIPWFRDPPLTITVAEALTQGAMHSQYHRGQIATRLREIGGVPATTDIIVWYWNNRPSAAWN